MASERWLPPRLEVMFVVELAAARHVVTMKWGRRYPIERVMFRWRRMGWDGEWRLVQETLIAIGRGDRPMYGGQIGSVPDWLDDLREKAKLEVAVRV